MEFTKEFKKVAKVNLRYEKASEVAKHFKLSPTLVLKFMSEIGEQAVYNIYLELKKQGLGTGLFIYKVKHEPVYNLLDTLKE